MGAVESLKKRTIDIMDDPDARATIKQIAYEHDMSIEDAKTYYLRYQD